MSSVFTVVLALVLGSMLFNSVSASSPSLESNSGWIGNFLQVTGLTLPIPSEIFTLCRESEKLLSVYPKYAAIEKFKKEFKACDSNYKNWRWSKLDEESLVKELEQLKISITIKNENIKTNRAIARWTSYLIVYIFGNFFYRRALRVYGIGKTNQNGDSRQEFIGQSQIDRIALVYQKLDYSREQKQFVPDEFYNPNRMQIQQLGEENKGEILLIEYFPEEKQDENEDKEENFNDRISFSAQSSIQQSLFEIENSSDHGQQAGEANKGEILLLEYFPEGKQDENEEKEENVNDRISFSAQSSIQQSLFEIENSSDHGEIKQADSVSTQDDIVEKLREEHDKSAAFKENENEVEELDSIKIENESQQDQLQEYDDLLANQVDIVEEGKHTESLCDSQQQFEQEKEMQKSEGGKAKKLPDMNEALSLKRMITLEQFQFISISKIFWRSRQE